MTEYIKLVEKQKEKLELEEWSNRANMIIVQNGTVETHYNSGRIKYQSDGKTWTKCPNKSYTELLSEMQRQKNDFTE